jgi:hypothetical protein
MKNILAAIMIIGTTLNLNMAGPIANEPQQKLAKMRVQQILSSSIRRKSDLRETSTNPTSNNFNNWIQN